MQHDVDAPAPRAGVTAVADRPVVGVALNAGSVWLRPLANGETGAVEQVFAGLSDRSRTARFLVPMPRLPASMGRMLADVDGVRHVAWLAATEGAAAGLARYVVVGPSTAEVALEVVDRYQGRGIGSALLDAITTVACVRGIRTLEATVLPTNRRSVALLGKVGLRQAAAAGGVSEARGPYRLMTPPRVDREAVARLALGGR
jgi:GNAT superfamily N-acetyltransferase